LTDPTVDRSILNKNTPVSLAIVIIVLAAFGIAAERVTSLEVRLVGMNKSIEKIVSRVDDSASRSDVVLIVQNGVNQALMDVYKELSAVKGRISTLEAHDTDR
jgi:predicted RND superfamily exporter protein